MKHITSLVTVIFIALVVLAGCASAPEPEPESVEPMEAAPEEVVEEPVAEEPVAEGPAWYVYDAGTLPADATPAFYESNTKGLLGESTIVDDTDIAGNSVLQFVSPDGPDNKLCWAMDLGMDLAQGATIAFRARLIPDNPGAMAFDMEFRTGVYRDRLIGYEGGTIKLDKAGVRGEFDSSVWNIVRVTLSEADDGSMQIDVYLNEDPTPVLSGTSTTEHGDNLFRFADGSGNDYAASLYDWVVWTTDGAFAPGTPLPDGLSGM